MLYARFGILVVGGRGLDGDGWGLKGIVGVWMRTVGVVGLEFLKITFSYAFCSSKHQPLRSVNYISTPFTLGMSLLLYF